MKKRPRQNFSQGWLYSSWYCIGERSPGTHKLRVSLSTHQHEELMHNGEPIAATLEVNIPAEAASFCFY